MKDLIRLGKITAPVGIKGELRVYPYIEDMTRFSDIEEILIEGRPYKPAGWRRQSDMFVIKLEGVADRNGAEALRNREICVKRNLLKLPEGEYIIDDLIGLAAVNEDGKLIGRLASVVSGPAQDIYRIEPAEEGHKAYMIPAVKEFIRSIDLEKELITVKIIEGMEEL